MTGIIEVIVTAVLLAINHQYETGYTSRYDPGVMEYQVAYHGFEWSDYDGAIAVADCRNIGQVWLIRPFGTYDWRRVVVADCAGRDAYDEDGVNWMHRDGVIVELDYETAVEFGAVRGGIEVEVLRP